MMKFKKMIQVTVTTMSQRIQKIQRILEFPFGFPRDSLFGIPRVSSVRLLGSLPFPTFPLLGIPTFPYLSLVGIPTFPFLGPPLSCKR